MKSDSSYSSAHSSSAHSFSSSANQSHLPDRDFNYTPADASERAVAKGGVACPFPWRLHEMLKVASEEGLEHIVSWAPHGKAFTVYKPQEFADLIMKRFFCQTKFASFQRQLNLYGFSRFCHGRDKGAYYHPCFLRGQRALVRHMIRRKIKGQAAIMRRPLPTEEPDFYNDTPAMEYENMPAMPNEQSQQQMNSVPPCVSFAEEQQASVPDMEMSRAVSQGSSAEPALDLSYLDGSFFPFAPNEQVLEPPPLPQPCLFDPAAELAKLRAQIRQKRAEYEQLTSSRREEVSGDAALDQYFTEQLELVPQQPPRRVSYESRNSIPAPTKSIPVYKGSYIAV